MQTEELWRTGKWSGMQSRKMAGNQRRKLKSNEATNAIYLPSLKLTAPLCGLGGVVCDINAVKWQKAAHKDNGGSPFHGERNVEDVSPSSSMRRPGFRLEVESSGG